MVRMRDLIRSGGSGDSDPSRDPSGPEARTEAPRPAAEPPPLRGVRFPSAPGERSEPGPEGLGRGLVDDADERFADIHGVIARLREAVRSGEALPVGDVQALVARVIQSLEHGNELFWLANNPPSAQADYVAAHLASVGVLALRIGTCLGYDRAQLADLGLAGFVFDLGLWLLPDRLLAKKEPLTPDEQSAYRTHPRLAADTVRRSGVEAEGVVEAVLQHHEREQGQGFPQGLPGSAIHPYAKVVGLIDTYRRLTSPKTGQPRLQPHEAIREIVRSKHDSFPSALIKALLSEISVFPPRTIVKLNTGEVGRVVGVNRNHPLRPRVEVIADSRGDRLPAPKLIDLSEAPFLYITGPVSEDT
jgi:HD-GYP domain-containing protein (c-di-GMP phosphodiesterase class II)